MTTDKVAIVDITAGLLAKVNFGVNSKTKGKGAAAAISPRKIIQEREKPVPRLNVSLFKDELIFEDSKLAKPAEFRIFTNYPLFIDKWKLEVLDKDTKALIKRFEGKRLSLAEPIYWDGKDKNNKSLKEDRNYVYVLTVTGRDGRQDVTKEKDIIVKSTVHSPQSTESPSSIESRLSTEYKTWLAQESKASDLDKQNIKIDGETIKVQNVLPSAAVRLMKGAKLEAEIPALKSSETAETMDMILPQGEYDVEVGPQEQEANRTQAAVKPAENRQQAIENMLESFEHTPVSTENQAAPAAGAFSQHIKVGEDYLFFVGMGDAKAGYAFNRGNVEPVQQDDKFSGGFWSEGKLAYYLKGKIKGKYLITSSLDTDRNKKELFRNLDPDKYYPIYGDASSVNYAATNTQGPLYLLIEWDKSSVLWGDYNVGFTDTEFASFDRTLYGGKLDYESVSVTQFGEPKTKLIVFRARAKQKAAHNEFIGTGGSLYFLKDKDVVEGSDKVRIEVRDKITGLTLTGKDMQRNVDYEIDYSNGRIIFWRPVSQIAESESIISTHLLNGNPVYVIVNYEFAVKDKYNQGNQGIRAQQSLTDYVRMGGTYVREEQVDKNYELKGADAILHLGKNVLVIGEYAQTQSGALGSFISTDGGLTFSELTTGDLETGKAYGLKGDAQILSKLGLSTYYKKIDKGFSSASTTSQQGKELMGMAMTLDLTSQTRLRLTHDIQKLIDNGNLQTQAQVGAQKTETTMAQITHEMDKLKVTGEYRHQKVTQKNDQFVSETNTQEDVIAAKADYRATDKVVVSLEQQATLKGSPNHQTSAAVTAELNKHVSLRAKQMIGNQGSSTSIGATANPQGPIELSGDYTRSEEKAGGVSNTLSLGGKAKINEKTEVHTALALTDTSSGAKTQSVVFGSKRKINDSLELASEQTYAKSSDQFSQAKTYSLTKNNNGRQVQGSLTTQRSQNPAGISNTNIFGLSGDINDHWAALVNFERGTVQNLDGTQSKRNAGSLGLNYVDKDLLTQEIKFKASSKLELRFDQGQENNRQYLFDNALEAKPDANTTFFVKANISQTANTTTNVTAAQYRELAAGFAYRPVRFDRLNLLGRYTYLENNSPAAQSDVHDIEQEKSHILAGEAIYDLTDRWQIVEKLAFKMGEEKVTGFDFTPTQTWLWVNRLNYNINHDWQVAAEFRRLMQKQAQDSKNGALVEVARKIGEFLQVGLGYNFTDFNDDLTHLSYSAQGPFVRLTGMFYDRSPEEIERARQKWLEGKIKQWAWELVQKELSRPGGIIMQALYQCFYLAEKAHAEGRLQESKELYNKILRIGESLYQEAEAYVRNRIEVEDNIKKENAMALSYRREGTLDKAKKTWLKIIGDAEAEPFKLEF